MGGPLVGQLEGLAHVEAEHPQPPAQVLERPNDGVLGLDRRPLAELIMTEVGFESVTDLGGEVAVRGLGCGRRHRCGSGAIRDRFRAPLWRRTFTPKHPLQGNSHQPARLGFRDDEAGSVRGKLLSMGPLLYRDGRHWLPQFSSELPVRQRDTIPRAEDAEEDFEAFRYGAHFGSLLGLDGGQWGPILVTLLTPGNAPGREIQPP